MKVFAWLGVAAGSLMLAHAACGFPEVEYLDTAATAGGGSSPNASVTGGGAGTAGAGGATSSTGGTGGAPCSIYEQNNTCGANMKCTVVDPQTGAIGCGVAGPKKRWEACNTDRDCDVGLWCDLRFSVCKPWCVNETDCEFPPFNGQCIVADDGDGNDIPGQPTHCIPDCDPTTASPCAINESITCVHIGSNRFDCVESRNFVNGADCNQSADCGPGLVCTAFMNDPFTCSRWCTPPELFSPDCGLGECVGLQPAISWEGTTMGSCF